MRVAFCENRLTYRGTTDAVYQYADYNETMLGNESIIITRKFVPGFVDIDQRIYDKFHSRFRVVYYTDPSEIDGIIEREKCDVFYCIKYGFVDGLMTTKCKNIMHCAGTGFQPHGEFYCAVSECMSKWQGHEYFLPHIVDNLPEVTTDFREELGIPANAIVFGRYGGMDVFGPHFIRNVVKDIVNARDDIYFIFMSTPEFYQHPQIKYFTPQTSREIKAKFIATSDAMFHARQDGETFGLAIGEFSLKNKPIIVFKHPPGSNCPTNHYDVLGDNAFYYKDADELTAIFNTFDRDDAKTKQWNMYQQFNPTDVMAQFKTLIDKATA